MMKKYLLLVLVLSFGVPAFATTFFVSSGLGKDTNSGLTKERPFKTIQKASDSAYAGDTVNIMDGTYTNSDNEAGFFQAQILLVMHSGQPDAWITFQPLEGHHPVLVVQHAFGIRVMTTPAFHSEVLAYIRIQGLKIVGNAPQLSFCDALQQTKSCYNPTGEIDWRYNGQGISIGSEGEYADKGKVTHHIEVLDCEVSDCASAGIGAYRADYVTIAHCKVYNNASKTSMGSSGIHIYNPRNSAVVDTRPYHYLILRNEVFNNRTEVPFYTGSECKGYTDGNGIIIDDANNSQTNKEVFTGNFLLENNVIYENGGSGISIFQSNQVTVRNNTTYKNAQLTPDSNKRGEIIVMQAQDITIINNIFYASTQQRGYYKGSKCKNMTVHTNLVFNTNKNSRIKHKIKKDPLFVATTDSDTIPLQCKVGSNDIVLEVIPNSKPKDLRLQNNSPAQAVLKAGTLQMDVLGKIIQPNAAFNLGAYQ